jgi:hypothetical protein
MNALVLFMIVVVTTFEFFTDIGWLPRAAKFAPELISGLVVLLVVLLGVRSRFQYVRPLYWVVFGSIAIVMLCGIIANALSPGTTIAGLRTYLRAIPLFLLPAVYAFSDEQLKKQLKLLAVIAVVQFPLAYTQREAGLGWGNTSGDVAVGTLLGSGYGSIFAVAAACVLAGLYQRKLLGGWTFVVLLALTLGTTGINETKASFVMLPAGLLVVYLVGAEAGARLRNVLVATAMVVVAGAVLVPIYDYYGQMRADGGGRLIDYVSDQNKLDRYVFADSTRPGARPGRGTAIRAPMREMSREPTRFGFGYGIGNVSNSALGPQFTGRYYVNFAPYLQTLASVYVLEIGFLGLALALLLCALIYRDCAIVARSEEGLYGAFAVGWAGVTVVIALSSFYNVHFNSVALSYLFWFGSGLVAARRMRNLLDGPA